MHIIFNNTIISNNLYFRKTYKKDDIVFSENDLCNRIGFVENGNITIVTPTYSENEYEINSISENGFFGAFLLFSDKPFYLGTGIATKTTQVIYFTKENLLVAFQNQAFLNNYLLLTSKSTLKIQNKIKVLTQKTIKDKIIFILLENYKRERTPTLKIKSKLQLANYLNVPRPSLSRELILLKNENIIDYGKYFITLKKIPD